MVARAETRTPMSQAVQTVGKWLILALALLLVSVAIVAITDAVSDGDVTPTSVSLAAVDDGRPIDVALDGVVTVRLEANPSTGYSWTVAAIDNAVMTLESDTYAAPPNGVVGQGGIQEMQFRAVGTGQTEITLTYWRPWEGDASIVETFNVTVDVADK